MIEGRGPMTSESQYQLEGLKRRVKKLEGIIQQFQNITYDHHFCWTCMEIYTGRCGCHDD